MDSFDIKILDALQVDGRLTNNELAERVGLSASQCSRRRTSLEATGLIRGYHAALDAQALGLEVMVFVQVTLATHSPDTATRFRELIARIPEVQEGYSLTGQSDYLLKMVLPDLRALARCLSDIFLPHPSVAHVHTSVVLERVKETARLPLGQIS